MIGIKTVIADNQKMFVEGVSAYLNIKIQSTVKIVDTASSAAELMHILEENDVDAVFMELNLPDMDGLKLIPELKDRFPNLRVSVLTSYGDYRFVKEAFQGGADGYLLKSNPIEEIVDCLNEIMDGNTFLSDGLRITPASNRNGSAKTDRLKSQYEDKFLIKQKLTRREQEVLELITQAKNNKEIANELFISDQTVGVHRKNIMRKLGVRNTVNLIKFALEHDIV